MKLFLGALVVALSAVAVPCEAALIHLYEFDTDASDSVGTADGTLSAGALVSGGVLSLDGAGAYVDFASFLVPTSGSFTVAMFAQETATNGNYMELISQGGGPGFYLGRTPYGGEIRAGDTWIGTGEPFASDGEVHHYALTMDVAGNTTKLFIDGVLEATLNAVLGMSAGGTNTRLGRQYGGYAEYFYGQMDDVRIYDEALTDREIDALAHPVDHLAPVPEPSTVALMLTGIAGVVVARRRAR